MKIDDIKSNQVRRIITGSATIHCTAGILRDAVRQTTTLEVTKNGISITPEELETSRCGKPE